MCERDSCHEILETAAVEAATTTTTQTTKAINTLRTNVERENASRQECKCRLYSEKRNNNKPEKLQEPQQRSQQKQQNLIAEQLRTEHKKITTIKTNVIMEQQQMLMQQQTAFMTYDSHSSSSSNSCTAAMPTTPAPTINHVGSNTALDTDCISDSQSSTSSVSSCTSFTGSCASSPPTCNSPSIGVNLRVTGQCSQGGRKYMEDYFSVAYQQSENAKDLEYAFIGIYDGHGGAEAATFAKEHLMMQIINQKLFWSDSDQDVLRAIREGYIATHYAMWREQDKWPKTANGLPSTAGTTATVAFIRREKIYIGHVGDSGIVLGYQNDNEHFWRAKQLTTDHKPESVAERTRIMRSGGKVIVKSGVPRVVWNRPRNAGHKGPIRRNTPVDEIPFLAVARSLGDLWSYNSARNEFIVSPDPDVKVIKINPKTFRCLIFGTDGLWNVVSAQEAVNTVHEKESINERLQAQRGDTATEGAQWTNPSKGLVEKALKTWSAKKMRADNTSVVTVILYPPCSSELTAAGTHSMEQQAPVLPPSSYGLEYTQLNAEVNTYDDAITYQEMAEKYLPPEEYRNFNYYEEEDVTEVEIKPLTPEEEASIDPLILKYNRGGYMAWRSMCDKLEYRQSQAEHSWGWAHEQQQQLYTSNATRVEADEDADDDDEADEEDEDDDDEDEELEEEADVAHLLDTSGADGAPSTATAAAYAHYENTALLASSLVGGDDANGGYMNSFAESYNSLLSEQMAQEEAAGSSNSNQPAYQSISSASMHELLQEQQQYQQQCMSEEEGYSLTKLETRREQQRCSGVQTFKIFQQHQQTSTSETNYMTPVSDTSDDETAGGAAAHPYFWNPDFPAISSAVNRYLEYKHLNQQQQLMQQQLDEAQKPLELDLLLQQEREEEQQVALERLALQQRHMTDVGTATSNTSTNFASAQTESEQSEESEQAPSVEQFTDAVSDASENENEDIYGDAEEPLLEEYLEDEYIGATHDETVQINEVSSSGSMEVVTETDTTAAAAADVEYMLVDETLPADVQMQTDTSSALAATLRIEKIEIVRDKPQLGIVNAKLKRHLPRTTAQQPAVAQLHYPNIPNENKHLQLNVAAYRTRHTGASPYAAAAGSLPRSSPMPIHSNNASTVQRRELRSRNPSSVDYSKRTLRSRNTLAKDLKAKPALTTTLKRSASITTQFLRTTASSLLHAGNSNNNHNNNNSSSNGVNAKSLSQPHAVVSAPCSRVAVHSSNASHSNNNNSSSNSNNNSRKNKVTKLHMSANAAPLNAINLRSRQVAANHSRNVNASVAAVANTNCLVAAAPTATTTVPVQRRERRNLRSVVGGSNNNNNGSNNKTLCSKDAAAPASMSTNYSKSTRLQSNGNTLAVPPPSPKLMNTAAAVAAATRARSLLAAKSAGVVTALCSKRATLRSGGAAMGAATAATSPPNTRSNRLAKKIKH